MNRPVAAYFSMEFGIRPDVKLYAGGLGILAGDYLKGAKDNGYPVVGIGIKWKQGYTDQLVDDTGEAYDTYHNYRYDCMEDTGHRVHVDIRGVRVMCRIWKWTGGEVESFYLLDTDLPENGGPERWITGQLYGWFGEERVAQELVLGAAGVRALEALGIEPDVYHFNEGHAVFAGIELIRREMERGASFKRALAVVRSKTVFTTHTPVIEGNESHPIARLLYMGAGMGLGEKELEHIGGSPFNMTVAALRLSRISNAVADLHRQTANAMWADVYRKSEIIGITNGIHLPTWVDSRMLNADSGNIRDIHAENKRALVDFVRERTGTGLDPERLIIGFSRRAVPYKRSDLIFRDPDFIEPLLRNRTIQLVFSGRAHPLDDNGKEIIANLVRIAGRYPEAVVFLENYDMTIGRILTRGADVWLNNPVRPKEASGTSGMKAAMNGVLNLSVLDGWWPEACRHGENGWQFGDGFQGEDPEEQDRHDMKALHRVLSEMVIPTFYDDPGRWGAMMRRSIEDTRERFSIERMLDEYYGLMYAAG